MEEKRRYFRINDQFEVRYTLIDTPQLLADDRARDLRELRLLVARLRVQLPDVAEALALIERRVLSSGHDGARVSAKVEPAPGLNLSGCGIAFLTDSVLPVGQHLHVEVHLRGNEPVLAGDARVVACDRAVGKIRRRANIVRVDLINMHAEDAEALVQYVLKRQAQMLRANRHVDSAWIT